MLDAIAQTLGVTKAKLMLGFAGAIVSMAWIKGPVAYRVLLFFGGLAAAVYATPLVTTYLDIPEGLGTEFLVGMFSMSIAAAGFRTIDQVDLTTLAETIAGAIRGRKDKG